MTRSLLRRALYRLPPPWVLRWRSARRAVLRRHDWADPVRRLRAREQGWLDATAAASRAAEPDPRRIAVFRLHHALPLEYGLATALRLRGHDVRGLLCDGLVPICELSLGPVVRPPCDTCLLDRARYEDAFGFDDARLSAFLAPADRTRAEELAAGAGAALADLVVEGVPVGLLARREVQRYYRGFVFEPAADPAFRRWIVAAILLTWAAGRWLDHERPDIVLLSSGRTLPMGAMLVTARRRGIRAVTWDGSATHRDGLMFSHGPPATEIPLDEAWAEAAERPLTEAERRDLERYAGRWARSENTPFPYNPRPVEDADAVRSRLGLRDGAPLIVAYTNTAWDIAVIDRDAGFDSMFDWLFAVVEHAIAHPDLDLVVRAHPAEKKVPPALQSRTPVGPEIRRRYDPLPDNVRIIEGDDPISSYTLAELADVHMVYSTRLGLELALRGIRPWIAGAVTYRGKGFTLDLASKEHMLELLEARAFDHRSTPTEIARAERFAYLWFFRYVLRLPLLWPADGRFTLDSFRRLGPGGDPVIDRLCRAIVNGGPFVDLGESRGNA